MKSDPRGFKYELEPLRRKSEWELQALRQTLARLNGEIVEQEQLNKQVQDRLSTATTEHLRQQIRMQIIHIDRQVIAHTYISELSKKLAQGKQMLSGLEDQRDTVVDDLHKLQKFADGLEEHREKELKGYNQVLAKAGIVDADDAWIRTVYWRSAQ